jgi:hypothetical protein
MTRRKARRQKRSEDEYTYLAIRVSSYEAEADASINHDVYYPQHAFELDDRDPVFQFITRLVITGTSTWPENRTGDVYEVTIYGDDAPSRHVHATLEDVQARDEYRARQYRDYRGAKVPMRRTASAVWRRSVVKIDGLHGLTCCRAW